MSLHLHDTRGTALANALAGYQSGIRIFDGSTAGLGGCPYAPGATGNAASEDLLNMFSTMGIQTNVDLEQGRTSWDSSLFHTAKRSLADIINISKQDYVTPYLTLRNPTT